MTRSGRLHRWWTRPCGGQEVLLVSLPLVVSTISTTVMIFIDRMFLLWYAPKAMAAAMPAGMLHFTVISFPLGVALYVNTFVAQYEGAGRPGRIGPIVWQGIWIGICGRAAVAGHDPRRVAAAGLDQSRTRNWPGWRPPSTGCSPSAPGP